MDTPQRGGAFYLSECDHIGRRTYHLKVDPEIKLSGPLISAPIPRTKEQLAFDKEAFNMPRPHSMGRGNIEPTARGDQRSHCNAQAAR